MRKLVYGAAASFVLATSAMAASGDNTLNIAWKSELTTLDRFNSASPEINIVQHLVFDGLIYRDPDTFEYKPALATEWEFTDDKTLELVLRRGVTFQNGEPFNADDVVATIKYITDPDNPIVTGNNTSWIDSAAKIGDYKVRINLKEPFPAAVEYLAGPIPMYPNEYLASVGKEGFSTKPIGTGPYRVTDSEPGRSITFEKNDAYWDGSPKGKPSIGKIVQRTIPDSNTQVAELLSGGIDWMWRVPEDQASKLGDVGNVTVQANETMRVGFILFDSSGRAGGSPFQKVAVRRAISHAIDRESMSKKLVGGGSRSVHTLCFPLQFGCTDEGAVKYEYSPDKAKKLLAEAGYPKGFEFDIYAFSNRPYTEAVVNYLRAVGVQANLRFLQFPALFKKLQAGEIQAAHMNWGSYGISDVSALTSRFFKGGKTDYAQDKDVQTWIEKADASVNGDERKQLYKKALDRIADQAYALPMFSYVNYLAFSSDLKLPPQADEFPHLYRAAWK